MINKKELQRMRHHNFEWIQNRRRCLWNCVQQSDYGGAQIVMNDIERNVNRLSIIDYILDTNSPRNYDTTPLEPKKMRKKK